MVAQHVGASERARSMTSHTRWATVRNNNRPHCACRQHEFRRHERGTNTNPWARRWVRYFYLLTASKSKCFSGSADMCPRWCACAVSASYGYFFFESPSNVCWCAPLQAWLCFRRLHHCTGFLPEECAHHFPACVVDGVSLEECSFCCCGWASLEECSSDVSRFVVCFLKCMYLQPCGQRRYGVTLQIGCRRALQ